MNVLEGADGTLTVTEVTWWPALATILFGVGALEVWFRDPPRRGDAFWSVLIALLALVCLAGLERSHFTFDRASRRLRWSRRGLVRKAGGELAFESINGISLERYFNTDSGRRSNARRIDLHTTSGLVPLTTGYSGGVAGQRQVAERIRTVLGLEGLVVE